MRDALRGLIDQLRLHGMASVLEAEIERAERGKRRQFTGRVHAR